MQIDQLSRKASPAPRRCDRDRKNLRFVSGHARQNEADEAASDRGPMGNDIAVKQQALDFTIAPAAMKRLAVEYGDRSGIARRRLRQSGLAAVEQAGQESDHRRGRGGA